MKLFGCAWVGGGIAGAILGALGGKMYAFSGDGLFRIPGMINPEGLDTSFYGFIACALIAMGVTAVLSFLLTDAGSAAEESVPASAPAMEPEPLSVYAPVKGTVLAQSEIPDETFASDALGRGVGIDPAEGVVYAPFDGEISSVVDTRHAVGITSKDGVELLIHVGVDTVKMSGDGFRVYIEEGDQVKIGQKLIEFDVEKIKNAGFSPVTAVLVLNADEYAGIDTVTGNCDQMKKIIALSK